MFGSKRVVGKAAAQVFSRSPSNHRPKNLPGYQEVVKLRQKYQSPSLRTFEAYDTPLVLTRGKMQYMWDSKDNKYIDLLGQNLCISVGHCHPTVVGAAQKTDGNSGSLHYNVLS